MVHDAMVDPFQLTWMLIYCVLGASYEWTILGTIVYILSNLTYTFDTTVGSISPMPL